MKKERAASEKRTSQGNRAKVCRKTKREERPSSRGSVSLRNKKKIKRFQGERIRTCKKKARKGGRSEEVVPGGEFQKGRKIYF